MVAFTPNRGYPYSTTGDPADIPAALQSLAEALDVDMQDLDDAIVRRPIAVVASSTSTRQVFPADQTTEATFDFVHVDTDGISNLSVFPTRLTPTAPGLWMVWGEIETPPSQADTKSMLLRVNGADLTAQDTHINSGAAGGLMQSTGAIALMNGTTDYFTMTFRPVAGLDDFRIRIKRMGCVRLTNT